ncbi:MAG: DUF4965 domain-containing protein [Clostridiaceae bacterium]|nr:DUF4965 domain-containing protein [Clostridiaceae bacterium]
MKNKGFRPPAVPLVTVDPYFSIWSMADKLFYDNTRHWTGAEHGLTGIARIDGEAYRFMGHIGSIKPMEQVSLEVRPLNTTYVFAAGGVELTVIFTTPLLLDDLDILSRPVSYITVEVRSIDGRDHQVQVYIDAAGDIAVNSRDQEVVWGRKSLGEEYESMYIGSKEQDILHISGDDIRIDWGYAHLVSPGGNSRTYIGSFRARQVFASEGVVPGEDNRDMPRQVKNDMPVMAACLEFKCDENRSSRYLILAYDDIYAIEYFCTPLKGYWARNGMSFEDMLKAAVREYDEIMEKCERFDKQLLREAEASGGKKYADIVSLAYRQVIAAHKLVADKQGRPLFFSKECFSNGCIATVDVSYPSSPLFLLYNPELVKGMLRPVFEFARTPAWKFDFAPHDVGRYPHANGQVYGCRKKGASNYYITPLFNKPPEMDIYLLEMQMPVEECGNMLIMTAAACLASNNADIALEYWDLISRWAKYLELNGGDPGNQLCTDDFAGHLAHNTNLVIKAIMGIKSYSLLCNMVGKREEAAAYDRIAREMAVEWERKAFDGDHYKLTFDKPGTWSMKYNLVWDIIFGTGVFSKEVAGTEINYYRKKSNRYGLPLDNRNEYTKSDWLLWCASMADDQELFEELIAPLWDFLNETPCRAPFTDWYETVTGYQVGCRCHKGGKGFRHRSVQGGLFVKLLKDTGILHENAGKYRAY